jgi:hypothetical protein
MSEKVDTPYEKDVFFKKWLVGLSERTKENYTNGIQDWLVFIGMTPTEQIRARLLQHQILQLNRQRRH